MSLSKPLALLLLILFGAASESVASIHRAPFNSTVNIWPPEPFRLPLPDYTDGYLVLHHYGPSGSVKDRTTLLTLLEMVTRANSIAPPGYPCPNVDLNFPDTGVFLRIRGTAGRSFQYTLLLFFRSTLSSKGFWSKHSTYGISCTTQTLHMTSNADLVIPTAPGFPSLSTKLALSASASFKSLVGRYGAKEMFISVHDGYLDYGPWGIMIKDSQALVNVTDRQ